MLASLRIVFETALVLFGIVIFTLYVRRQRLIRRYQMQLIQSKQQHREFFDLLNNFEETLQMQQGLIFKYRLQSGHFVYTSGHGQLMGRLNAKSMVGRRPEDVHSPGIASQLQAYYLQAWHSDEVVHGEITSPSNHVYFISLNPVKVSGIVTEVAGFAFDITEQKTIELALQQSEQRYYSLVEMSPEGIVVHRAGKVLFTNWSAARMLGAASTAELLTLPVLQFVHEEDRSALQQMFRQDSQESGKYDVAECRLVRLDGDVRHVEVLNTSVLYDGHPAVQTVLHDITERKRTEELLHKSRTLAVVGEMAAGIAHEIRNPLTSLRGFVQLLNRGSVLNKSYFPIMLSELDRINFIVSELLMLAKPHTVHVHNLDVRQVLHDVTALLEAQAILNDIVMHFDFPDELEEVACDANQMKQVFINVIQNAIEAMPNGGNIYISVVADAKDVCVRVADEGCGIPSERMSTLGEPFYTTKEKGTGLGLMVSYKIVQNHNGHIQVESEEGRGTTVSVCLPAVIRPGMQAAVDVR